MIDIDLAASINKTINSGMPLPDLLLSILDVSKSLIRADASSILLVDRLSGDLVFKNVRSEKKDGIMGERVPRGMGIAGAVAESGNPLIVNDPLNDPRFFRETDIKSGFYTSNILCLPMIVKGETIGVLEIINKKGNSGFSTDDMKKGEYLAEQAAIAITNRQLYEDLDKRVQELSALFEVSEAISFSRDYDVFQKIISSLVKNINVRSGVLMLMEGSGVEIKYSGGRPENGNGKPGFTDELISKVLSLGQCLIDNDGDNSLYGDNQDLLYKVSSGIAVPVNLQNRTVGVIMLKERNNRRIFDYSDKRLLEAVANQVGEAYKNILNRENEEKQKLLAHEMEIAARIQNKILSDIPATLNGHRLASFNRPAKNVGGDFFDYYKIDDKKYSLLIADISGKGIPAALFMGSARNFIRNESRIDYNPGSVLRNSNKSIYLDSEFGMFITLFYALIDESEKKIHYSSGGHNNQLLIKKTGEAVKLKTRGKALGLIDDSDYEEKWVHYESGDMLVMFTDGVVEILADDDLDIDVGETRLVAIALKLLNSGPAGLISYFEKYMSGISGNPSMDDFTLLAVQF